MGCIFSGNMPFEMFAALEYLLSLDDSNTSTANGQQKNNDSQKKLWAHISNLQNLGRVVHGRAVTTRRWTRKSGQRTATVEGRVGLQLRREIKDKRADNGKRQVRKGGRRTATVGRTNGRNIKQEGSKRAKAYDGLHQTNECVWRKQRWKMKTGRKITDWRFAAVLVSDVDVGVCHYLFVLSVRWMAVNGGVSFDLCAFVCFVVCPKFTWIK